MESWMYTNQLNWYRVSVYTATFESFLVLLLLLLIRFQTAFCISYHFFRFVTFSSFFQVTNAVFFIIFVVLFNMKLFVLYFPCFTLLPTHLLVYPSKLLFYVCRSWFGFHKNLCMEPNLQETKKKTNEYSVYNIYIICMYIDLCYECLYTMNFVWRMLLMLLLMSFFYFFHSCTHTDSESMYV